jgi:hypothetical protein
VIGERQHATRHGGFASRPAAATAAWPASAAQRGRRAADAAAPLSAGPLGRLVLPPTRTLALVEYLEAQVGF